VPGLVGVIVTAVRLSSRALQMAFAMYSLTASSLLWVVARAFLLLFACALLFSPLLLEVSHCFAHLPLISHSLSPVCTQQADRQTDRRGPTFD